MRFIGNESEINQSSGGKDTEFSEWKWTGPEEVIEQVHLKASLTVSTINMLLFSHNGMTMHIRACIQNPNSQVHWPYDSITEKSSLNQ